MSGATWTSENIGVFGYGSLVTDAGADIEPHIIARVSTLSPWPVEYARRSAGRGGGPTLVIHPRGHRVGGMLLVLDVMCPQLETVREWLWKRENRPAREAIKEMRLGGLDNVLYTDLEANIIDSDLNAATLADFAIQSVSLNPGRNGIRYLRDNIEQGIQTPLTASYRQAILERTGTNDLDKAEAYVIGRP